MSKIYHFFVLMSNIDPLLRKIGTIKSKLTQPYWSKSLPQVTSRGGFDHVTFPLVLIGALSKLCRLVVLTSLVHGCFYFEVRKETKILANQIAVCLQLQWVHSLEIKWYILDLLPKRSISFLFISILFHSRSARVSLLSSKRT